MQVRQPDQMARIERKACTDLPTVKMFLQNIDDSNSTYQDVNTRKAFRTGTTNSRAFKNRMDNQGEKLYGKSPRNIKDAQGV